MTEPRSSQQLPSPLLQLHWRRSRCGVLRSELNPAAATDTRHDGQAGEHHRVFTGFGNGGNLEIQPVAGGAINVLEPKRIGTRLQ